MLAIMLRQLIVKWIRAMDDDYNDIEVEDDD